MAGRPVPLGVWLLAQPPPTTTVILTFADIEQVQGTPLPPRARTDPAWWTDAAHEADVRAWRLVGWEVTAVDGERGRVTFARIRGAAPV